MVAIKTKMVTIDKIHQFAELGPRLNDKNFALVTNVAFMPGLGGGSSKDARIEQNKLLQLKVIEL